MKKIIFWLAVVLLPVSGYAGKLNNPPNSMMGIGHESCASFVEIYDDKQRINRGEEKNTAKIIGTMGAYADFNGTMGGFFAASMMEHGDNKVPFDSDEHALSLAYELCKRNLEVRFIDIVYAMSQTAFGRKAY